MRRLKDIPVEYTSTDAYTRAVAVIEARGNTKDALAKEWYRKVSLSGYPKKLLIWNIYRKLVKYSPKHSVAEE